MDPLYEIGRDVALSMLARSGVREWNDQATRLAIADAAIEIAARMLGYTLEDEMALPDYAKVSPGTAKTLKSSGGDAAITLASLANGNGTSAGARQAVTLDFGANWDREHRMDTEFELAATPTAGNVINIYGSWSDTTGAGMGNTSGTDAAYTGYSNNIDAAAKQLEFLGAHICTAQATATVQKANCGIVRPKARYLNTVVDNRSGAAFHSSDANCLIRFTPLVESIID